jgi:ATP-dependent DNA helicase RecQ
MHSPTVVKKRYDQLKTFGVGRELSITEWQDYLLQMLQMGFVEIAYNESNHAKITLLGFDVLYGRKTVELSVVDHSVKEEPSKPRLSLKIPSVNVSGLPQTNGVEDPKLFEALRTLRKQCAEEEGYPPYIVFSDKVLHALATLKPTTIEQFGFTPGVGEHKRQKYGLRFLEIIKKYV